MKLFEEKEIFKSSEYDRSRKKQCFQDFLSLSTFVISELWKMNDVVNLSYKDLKMGLELMDRRERLKMKKGLTTVSKELLRISNELKEYCQDNVEFVDEEVL